MLPCSTNNAVFPLVLDKNSKQQQDFDTALNTHTCSEFTADEKSRTGILVGEPIGSVGTIWGGIMFIVIFSKVYTPSFRKYVIAVQQW